MDLGFLLFFYKYCLIQPNLELKLKGKAGLNNICKKITKILGPNFKIHTSFIDELKKTSIGKYRYLDQKLKINL